MVYCVYHLTTGQFLRGWPNPPTHDESTEGIQIYPEHLRPDQRTERYDATSKTKKRAATQQEIDDWDAARQTLIEQGQFDGQKMLKAVAIWTAGKLGVPLPTAKAEILAIYRGLGGGV
jgi:hypothetical protein